MGRTKDLTMGSLIVVSMAWAGRIGWDVHREFRSRQLQQPDSYPTYADFLTGLKSFAGMLVVQLFWRRVFRVVARAMIPKKQRWTLAIYNLKVDKCCDSVFRCVYYVAMTAWCFTLLRGEAWTPWVLGGRGETRFCWTDGYPFQVVPQRLQLFYLTACGFHLSEMAMLFLEERHPDFWEMLLHHTLSVTLVCFSYMLNYVRIGSLVLLLHGATDVLIYASKALVDTANIRLVVVTYFGLIAAYAWFRILVFPSFIIRSAWIESISGAGSEIYGWGYMNFALCALYLLHMYWFGLIVRIGFHYRLTGEARDLQSNLSRQDLGKETKKWK